MAVAEDLLEGVRAFIGIERKCFVTEVDALSVARYARSIDDQNTLYFDAAAARACGYKGIIAPPNYLASVLDWSEGPPLAELREDGTGADQAPGVPRTGVRLMGGGVRLVCHEPVTVGMRVYLSSTLRSVDVRASTSGELAVLIYHNKYETAEGRLLQSCIRTMLLR